MAPSVASARRIVRAAPRTTLGRRPDAALPFVEPEAAAGHALLLDTCVYIDQMKGQAPDLVEDLLSVRVVNHSAIALQELMYTVGVLDPADLRTDRAVAAIERTIDAMPSHRLFTPDAETLAMAAVYAGLLGRLQVYAKDDRTRALADCVLFLQALKLGFAVLTRNVADFDLLLQLRPEGRVLFYRV